MAWLPSFCKKGIGIVGFKVPLGTL